MESKLFSIENRADTVVARFHGPRITNVDDIRSAGQALMRVIEEQKPTTLVLDLEKVNYLPSAMLGKLAAIRTSVSKQGGKLRLVNLQEPVEQLFEMTRLNTIFEIFSDLDSALN
ncbi:MAG: STAS domain-containing protein [Planctomycetota bacterium]|jgi:anti-sigma B factor antagonist|nr:STAS domain-containing protein [Planctomycetota bacterium]